MCEREVSLWMEYGLAFADGQWTRNLDRRCSNGLVPSVVDKFIAVLEALWHLKLWLLDNGLLGVEIWHWCAVELEVMVLGAWNFIVGEGFFVLLPQSREFFQTLADIDIARWGIKVRSIIWAR